MPKGSAIRPSKHGEIRHRAPERAAMNATRRVLDARDSTPTIRTNLPWPPVQGGFVLHGFLNPRNEITAGLDILPAL